ncbi:NDxxF motif lipoprotein [Cytobacillus sp. Sa5YUA1]|uniref:NDxxF motif lipoprotein n=1 Tax=Cytobacillus stercorigallinarum TaxID=2762240 RepID=A0ABR8QPU1_9BACI|nr:NDxxF motif lipoprotein [Cytobacillus stercorigallinarum]MBD7937556.1 NDxxF motif lipoprotein [Cytobacillus stercorigallinarum]
MKRLFCILILFMLSACSNGESIDTTEDEMLDTKNVDIPSIIFTSNKQNSVIDEKEMKSSIKTYLDTYEALYLASYPFQGKIDDEIKLTQSELDKLDQIYRLTKENDENFSNYISQNTLPEGYLEESERISRYITGINEMLYEIDIMLNQLTDDIDKGVIPTINLDSITKKSDVVNGREQKKIEEFLERKDIDTNAFGENSLRKSE